ncbi:MAG: hypothetical protein WCI72_05480 [archaeon]
MENETRLPIPLGRLITPTSEQIKWLNQSMSVSLPLDMFEYWTKESYFVDFREFNKLEFGPPEAYWFGGQIGNGLRLILTTDNSGLDIHQPKWLPRYCGGEMDRKKCVDFLEISLGLKHHRFGKGIETRACYSDDFGRDHFSC